MSSVRLFVYGSLKSGFRHHDLLEGARTLARAVRAPGHRLVRWGEYPAMVRQEPEAGPGVLGELYEVCLAQLPKLDAFEECPELYQRDIVSLADGTEAFAYVIDAARAAGLDEIPGGSWTRELEAQRSDIGL